MWMAMAEWVDAVEEKQRIWELHRTTPEPLGFDPQPHYGTIDHPYYGLLRITPWRIELGNLYGEPMIWRDYARSDLGLTHPTDFSFCMLFFHPGGVKITYKNVKYHAAAG